MAAKVTIDLESIHIESIDVSGGKINEKPIQSNLESTVLSGEKNNEKPNQNKPPPIDIASAQKATKTNLYPSLSLTPRTPRGLSRYETFRDKDKKLGHRRVNDVGQVTYKKIGTSQIMGSIQLGIHQAVGGLANKPKLDLLIQDFYVIELLNLPSEGSQSTPAHTFSDFKFKVYAPIAFRHFRDRYCISPDDYMISLCDENMRELTNPGASGSIFYLTCDDEFIVKTVQHQEAEFLQKLLPGYYMNLDQNPRTLLPKFFGLYTYQCNAKNIRLIVMNNLLPSSIQMHQKYDLKGSTYKRKASKLEKKKNSPTYKDLDFMKHHPDGILLEPETYKALIYTIERDCRVLTSFNIMDYSLLIGIYNLDQAAKEKEENNGNSAHNAEAAECSSNFSRSRSINRQRLVAHSTAIESIQADSDNSEEDHVPSGGIPARNSKGEKLLLFLGIIDILQSYRFIKKLEHTLKSIVHDGDTISVHRPSFYAERFQKFMSQKVFKEIQSPLRQCASKRRGASVRVRPKSQSETDSSKRQAPPTEVVVPSLPAVLQERPIRQPPPPVPPRSPKVGQERVPLSTTV